MYNRNLFEIVYEDHKEIYDLDTLNCYLIYMPFDELISNLDNINLNDDNQIIKIDKDKKLFSKDWISKYETFKHNNMCLILYKEEKNYIKVAEIEFINFELSDIDVIFKEINNLKKENVNLKNRISELENINKQPVISDELSTYFEYKKNKLKCTLKDMYSNIKILYEDNIFVYILYELLIEKGQVNIISADNMIIKELIVSYVYDTRLSYGNQVINVKYIQPYIPSRKFSCEFFETIEIIIVGSNNNYDIGKRFNFNTPEFNRNLYGIYSDVSNQIEFFKKFKNLKKLIFYDIEVRYQNKESGDYDYYFFPLPEKYIQELKENFGDKLEIKSWNE